MQVEHMYIFVIPINHVSCNFLRWLSCAANGKYAAGDVESATRNVKPTPCYEESTATFVEPTAGIKLF